MEAIAHTKKSYAGTDKEALSVQSLDKHLIGTAAYSQSFASKIGLPKCGRLIGLAHDIGKYSGGFQKKIRDEQNKAKTIDHSTAGAQYITNNLPDNASYCEKLTAKILSLVITGHHSGLMDVLSSSGEDNYKKRLEKCASETYINEVTDKISPEIAKEIREILSSHEIYDEIKQFLSCIKKQETGVCATNVQARYEFDLGMLVKILFSCLVDADRCNTADFCVNAFDKRQKNYVPWGELLGRLEDHLDLFPSDAPLSCIRKNVSDWCKQAGARPRGIYTLTAPTGSGKTLAGFRFGLEHAKRSEEDPHPLERIIYILPHTNIIEQNADTIRKILEKDASEQGKIVLECHSNLTSDKDTWQNKVLSENWDAPIIVTTYVQFFESIFSNSPNKLRRLHQMANAVLIFDEVQKIPVKQVHLFCSAINFLVNFCGTSVLLTTATQPLLNSVNKVYGALNYGKAEEVIPDTERLYQDLKRVHIYSSLKPGGYTIGELAEMTLEKQQKHGNVLVIVNTTQVAKDLYAQLTSANIPVSHLSARMCPEHRASVLRQINNTLAEKKPMICVATNVIEAGIDIDFCCVIRSLAGFDSLIQSAGRCNREGLLLKGYLYVVNIQEEKLQKLPEIKKAQNCAYRVIYETCKNQKNADLSSLSVINQYYKYYFYERKNEMCYNVSVNDGFNRNDTLLSMLSYNRRSGTDNNSVATLRQAFASAGNIFQAIDKSSVGVIVPYGAGQSLINEISACHDIYKLKQLLRQAQRFSVSVYPEKLEKLVREGVIYPISEDAEIWGLKVDSYDLQTGL